MVIAWILIGYYDLGFFWFRIAIMMGVALGAIEGIGVTKVAKEPRRWAGRPAMVRGRA
jgi:hypothetical protein